MATLLGNIGALPNLGLRFIAFMQTKSADDSLIGEEDLIVRPRELAENATEEQKAARNTQQQQNHVKV